MTATVTLQIGKQQHTLTAQVGSLIADLPQLNDGNLHYLCAKKGICNKCLIHATGELSPKTAREQALPDGVRLACCTRILGDVNLVLDERVDNPLQSAERVFTATHSARSLYQRCGLAVDIGTTTIAVSLIDEQEQVYTICGKNPQLHFGADVVSRIEQSIAGNKQALADTVIEGINQLIYKLCIKAGVGSDKIDGVVITANTAMLHLLLQQDCTALSKAPFQAEFLAGCTVEKLGLAVSQTATVWLPHCMSAFVGADIATAILASGMLQQDKTALLVDIGTNGEMALWHDGKLSCCSTAAGPAFEGVGVHCGMHGTAGAIEHVTVADSQVQCKVIGDGPATGICGSGVIDAIATMLALEVLDETGRLEEDDPRVARVGTDLFFSLQGAVGMYGKDVRAIQLAKSAICAGIMTLLEQGGVCADELDVLYLAGGFGSFIDLQKAGEIGLIPLSLVDKVVVLGNAALLGAQQLLVNRDNQAQTKQMQQQVHLVDLATSSVFMDQYVQNMFFL